MTSPSVTAVGPGPEDSTSIDGVAEPDDQFAVEWQVADRVLPSPTPATVKVTVKGNELS